MRKFALTAVASAVILSSGSMLSDRAEAMTLGGTAAGVRLAMQDISSVGAIQYGNGRGYYDRYERRYYEATIVPRYWWWGHESWMPQSYVIRPDIRFGAYCWRQNVGYGVWVRPCPTRRGFYP